MIPDRTSPLPAVARAGLPALLSTTSATSSGEAPGRATAVSEPFNRTMVPVASARRRAAARRSSPGAAPAMRAYSPSWGVRMLGPLRLSSKVRAAATSPSAVNASASITSGTATAAMTARISSATAAPVPRPGPITTALHFAVASRKAPAHPSAGRCMRTASVGQAALGSPGDPSRSMPAPAAMAPRLQRIAAPSMPAEPAATPTAVVHLLTCRGRGGTLATSASSTSRHRGVGNAIPMSATSTVPLSGAPAPCSKPGFNAAKVTVRSAHTASPGAAPVSASTPDGMSMASTAAPAGTAGASYEPRKPVPYAPSTTRSQGGSAAPGLTVSASRTRTRAPRRARTAAATRPSAPLLPLPATTTMRRP